MKTRKELISSTPFSYGKKNPKKYITVHQTGNTRAGADADAHARLQKNKTSGTAWHYTVDDKESIQSFDHKFQLWAAGDGRGKGNTESIHVEICVNSDGDYKKAVENGAQTVANIMKKEGISIANVKQHNFWSGKNCPEQIRAGKNGITWNDFMKMVENRIRSTRNKKQSTPKAPTTKNPTTLNPTSVVDFLKSVGVDSSYSNRAKLAKKHGIANYKGTASQNIQLLKKLRGE